MQLTSTICQEVPDLLSQIIRGKDMDVVVISKLYRNHGGDIWFKDETS